MYSSSSDENSDRLQAAAWFLVAGAVLFFCCCLLLWFSWLRETRQFWLNSGGYPILLRDMVLVAYFPLLVLTFLGLLALTLAVCSKLRTPVGLGCFKTLVISACWGLICSSLVISFGNNAANLWNGRPLHHKPPTIKR